RRSAPTRISTGAIARRKPHYIATTEYRPTGVVSDRRVAIRIMRQTPQRLNACADREICAIVSAIASIELARCGGNSRRADGFSPHRFLIREKPHVRKTYRDRPGRFCVACGRRVRANSDCDDRPRRYGGHHLRLLIQGRLAGIEAGWP